MKFDFDSILVSLKELGYAHIINNIEDLKVSLTEDSKSIILTRLVSELSKELQLLCKLESSINAIDSIDDFSNFVLELSSFLKELHCPYKMLIEGPVSQRLVKPESRIILLEFLISELYAARMISIDKPDKVMQLEIQESSVAQDLKLMLIALGFGKLPTNITAQRLFFTVEGKVKALLKEVPPTHLSKPLFTGVLTMKQWDALEKLQKQMHEQYKLRKEMLITRVKCTIQSFQWADRLKPKIEEINKVFAQKLKYLSSEPAVHFADILAAREDLAIIEKTSSARLRQTTKCEINKVIIGAVPDRGGRPEEQQPPPPEMPSWQKQRSEGPSSRGGHGGDRVQRGGQQQTFDNRSHGGRQDSAGRQQNYEGKGGPHYVSGKGMPQYNNSKSYSQSYNQGYDQSYNQAHNQGYDQGYNQGYNQAYAMQGVPLYAQPGYSPYAAAPPLTQQHFSSYDKPRGRGGGRGGRGGGRGGYSQHNYSAQNYY